eukprot:SAG25_NODE_11472_length_303_cov_1.009804_1_plen_68_part_01
MRRTRLAAAANAEAQLEEKPGEDVNPMSDLMDVVASAEYLRRGAQGRIVLRLERGLPVDGPGHASVGP